MDAAHWHWRFSAIINGCWNVIFEKGRGTPATAVFQELSSYTTNALPGIKYFSGMATYTKTIKAPAAWLQSCG